MNIKKQYLYIKTYIKDRYSPQERRDLIIEVQNQLQEMTHQLIRENHDRLADTQEMKLADILFLQIYLTCLQDIQDTDQNHAQA